MVDGSIQIMNDEYGGCKQHLFTVSSHEQIEHVCTVCMYAVDFHRLRIVTLQKLFSIQMYVYETITYCRAFLYF